ncbi:MAG: hypothetical protein HQ579_09540 [Candidatus Omnitrophica bacterium]|nr:hypothetical protein [Candidatus Omnitrophota bacterium]
MNDSNGNPQEVKTSAHSSNHAMFIALNDDEWNEIKQTKEDWLWLETRRVEEKGGKGSDEFFDKYAELSRRTGKLMAKIREATLQESGAICNLEAWAEKVGNDYVARNALSQLEVVNDQAKKVDIHSVQYAQILEQIRPLRESVADIQPANLDHVKGRDYAAGRQQKAVNEVFVSLVKTICSHSSSKSHRGEARRLLIKGLGAENSFSLMNKLITAIRKRRQPTDSMAKLIWGEVLRKEGRGGFAFKALQKTKDLSQLDLSHHQGASAQKPGKSPEGALETIALSNLSEKAFTLKEFLQVYEEKADELEHEPGIAETTAKEDLYLKANSLVKQGILEILKKRGKNGAYLFKLTKQGRAKAALIEAYDYLERTRWKPKRAASVASLVGLAREAASERFSLDLRLAMGDSTGRTVGLQENEIRAGIKLKERQFSRLLATVQDPKLLKKTSDLLSRSSSKANREGYYDFFGIQTQIMLLDTPLEQLELPKYIRRRILNRLLGLRVGTVGELITRFSKSELLGLRVIGVKSVTALETALAELGVSLRNEAETQKAIAAEGQDIPQDILNQLLPGE